MFCYFRGVNKLICVFQDKVHMGNIIAIKDALVFNTASKFDNDSAVQAGM
jgi:hydrogenase maturation factor HypF (carbamoyltransferase family)